MKNVESFLVFGSNLGDRHKFIGDALDLVAHSDEVALLNVSGIYETEPVEVREQPSFLNVAALISTSVTPIDLLRKLKRIEITLGRKNRERWHEREIDIDIIFYGQETINTEELTIPHPKADLRMFVLKPLSEIAPNYMHPILHKTVSQLLRECKDSSAVVRVGKPLVVAN